MKLSKVNIAEGTILRELLNTVAVKDNNSLTIEELNDIINKSESIIDSNELMSSVHFSVNGIEMDFDDIIIAFSNLFSDISKKLEFDSKIEELNKKIDLGVQDKLDNEYEEIFNEVRAIHQLIESNRVKIEEMYSESSVDDNINEGDHGDAGDTDDSSN